LLSYIEYICGKQNVRMNVPLANYTTMRVGGDAKFFVRVQSRKSLLRLISALGFIEYPYRILGGGSNIIVPDNGFDGVVIKLCFSEIVENGNFIYADAGANTIAVSKRARDLGLTGLEFACGIPGTVGGAVYGNAGAFGSCISNVVVMVDVLANGEIISVDAGRCKFDYRTSVFKRKRNWIIIGAYFALGRGEVAEITETMRGFTEKRLAVCPKNPNAGSVFRNPEGQSAGHLIDKLGLKGKKVGGASIHLGHANFIINDGDATARDILKLVAQIKKRVRDAYGIKLMTEVEVFK